MISLENLCKELIDAIEPILSSTCEIGGTCRDCLDHGRGTHGEQVIYIVEQIDKLIRKREEL